MPKGVDAVLQMKQQTGKGVAATFSAADYAIPFVSESLQARPTVYQSEALRAQAVRDRRLARLGTLDVGGSVEIEATNKGLDLILPLVFADVTSDPAYTAPNYKKTYKPTLIEPPYVTVGISDGETTRLFTDCKVGSFSLSGSINQLARFSLEIAGIQASVNGTPLAGSIPTVEYGLYFEHAKVKLGKAGQTLEEIPVSTFNIGFNRNLNTNRYQMGSRFRRDINGQRFDITGSFSTDANPLTDKQALYKAVLDAEWMELEVSFTDPTNQVTGGTGSEPSSFTIKVPYALLEWPGHNISGPDYIEGSVNFTAFAEGATAPSIIHVYKL